LAGSENQVLAQRGRVWRGRQPRKRIRHPHRDPWLAIFGLYPPLAPSLTSSPPTTPPTVPATSSSLWSPRKSLTRRHFLKYYGYVFKEREPSFSGGSYLAADENIMDWLIENKEWLFSGVLVAVPLAVLSWVFGRRSAKRIQKQRAGAGSTNVQIAGDLRIEREAKDE